MSQTGRMMLGWGRVVLDALLPPQCLTCDQPVPEPGLFCAGCFATMRFISAPYCGHCGTALDRIPRFGPPVCVPCAEDPPPWRRARAALQYDANSRRLILPLKHGDRTDLATSLGRLMARAGADLLDEADILVPVPLHRSRLRRRKYNQALLLAQAVGRVTHRNVVPDALVRLKATLSLGELNAERRAAMVANTIALRSGRGHAVAGRRIVLVDDVLTSGATARECTRALLGAAALSVDLLVVARTPAPRDG